MTRLFVHPEPIIVNAAPDGTPANFYHRGKLRKVAHICNRWRLTSSWWNRDAAAAREYVKLVTVDGLLCTIYRDMTNDAWYLGRIYD